MTQATGREIDLTGQSQNVATTERLCVRFPAMADRVPLRNAAEVLRQLHRYYVLASYSVIPGYASDIDSFASRTPVLWEDDELTVGRVRYGSQFAVLVEAVQPYTPLFLIWYLPHVARRGAVALKPWVELRELVLDGRSRRDRIAAEVDIGRAEADLKRAEAERLRAETARYDIGTKALEDLLAFQRQVTAAVEAAPAVADSRALIIDGGQKRRFRWLGHRRGIASELQQSARLLTALAGPVVVEATERPE